MSGSKFLVAGKAATIALVTDHSAFVLSEGQQRLFQDARRTAREALAQIAKDAAPGRVNRRLVRALGDHGVLPRLFPAALGGTHEGEISSLELCLLREALAQESTEAETALALQGLGAYPILQSGATQVASQWIPRVARGEAVAAFALTEPAAGSDAASLRLRAERDRDGFRLTGTKMWISNAPEADVYTIFARTTAGAGARGVTAFVLPADTPGVSGSALELLSRHPIGRLEVDGAWVPAECVLGEIDAGFKVAMRTLDLFRPSVGAYAVGMAQAALDAAVAHAGSREAFGKPLREFQAVSHQLAEMATRIQAARLLVYWAASAYDRGERVTKASAMAKLFATETAQFVVDAAVQIHGAAALEHGHLLEHLYREVRAPRIYEGTSEVQREVISRELYPRASS